MKKYFVIFKNSLQANLAYRFNTFSLFFAECLSLLVFVYLWISIYHQGNQMGDYTLKGLVIYYVFSKFIILTVRAGDVGRVVGNAIREGGIINYLVRPINFLHKEIASHLGVIMHKIFIYLPIFLLIIFIFLKNINFTFVSILLFFISLFVAIAINFLIFYIVGILTFFLGFVAGLNFAVYTIAHFLSGSLIPIDLFPKYLFDIINYLPFKYMAFVPISIITGKITTENAIYSLGIGCIWILLLYFFAVLLYNIGIKKYEAYGV